MRKKVDSLLANNAAVVEKANTTLRSGKQFITLISKSGDLTTAGNYYQQKTGTTLDPTGYNLSQTPLREGNTEYVTLRSGKRVKTRIWDAVSGEYRFTKNGNEFYKQLRRNYVISIPVKIIGLRANGTTYELKSSMPIEKLGLTKKQLPLNLTHAERKKRIKDMVQDELPLSGPLMHHSQEEYLYDESGAWAVNEETVGTDPGTGKGESHVILDRRVGTLGSGSFLFQDAICKEAFESHDDMCCVPRQIAAVLKRDFGEVCEDMSIAERVLYGDEQWPEKGCTPNMVLEYAKMHSLGVAVIHNEQVIESIPGKRPVLAFAVHEHHCYFYSTKSVCNALASRKKGGIQRLKKEQKQSTTPAYCDWQQFKYDIRHGHFWCNEEEVDSVRSWLLSQGKHPRVMMKDALKTKSLMVHLSKNDGGGICHIHGVPEEAPDIQQWLDNLELPGLRYKGEGLPNISQKVLLHLTKQSKQERAYLTPPEKTKLLDEYDHRCAICRHKCKKFEWDHIKRFAESWGDQHFQPLCPECHTDKTNTESRSLDSDFVASHFEKNCLGTVRSKSSPSPSRVQV